MFAQFLDAADLQDAAAGSDVQPGGLDAVPLIAARGRGRRGRGRGRMVAQAQPAAGASGPEAAGPQGDGQPRGGRGRGRGTRGWWQRGRERTPTTRARISAGQYRNSVRTVQENLGKQNKPAERIVSSVLGEGTERTDKVMSKYKAVAVVMNIGGPIGAVPIITDGRHKHARDRDVGLESFVRAQAKGATAFLCPGNGDQRMLAEVFVNVTPVTLL